MVRTIQKRISLGIICLKDNRKLSISLLYKILFRVDSTIVERASKHSNYRYFLIDLMIDQRVRVSKNQEFKEFEELYIQYNNTHSFEQFGDSCFGVSGCCPASLSFILNHLEVSRDTVVDVGRLIENTDNYQDGVGTKWRFIDNLFQLYKVKVQRLTSFYFSQSILEKFDSKEVCVLISTHNSLFTESGHFLVITNVKNENIEIFDSNTITGKKVFKMEEINSELDCIWVIEKALDI